jgi:hypothetical protein
MDAFTKTQENYIEHEVQLRVHGKQFKSLEDAINRLDNKIEGAINRLDNKIDVGLKHLDNKFMLMFSIILGSIWLPAILHYLHIA